MANQRWFLPIRSWSLLLLVGVLGQASGSTSASGEATSGAGLKLRGQPQPAEQESKAHESLTAAHLEAKEGTKEVELSTPPPANQNDLGEIIKGIASFFYNEIYNSRHQNFVSLAAFVVGLILIISGKRFYDWLIVLCLGVVAMVMAMNFIASSWAISVHSMVTTVAGTEVGLVVAYATWKGIEGMNIAVSVAFGAFLAYRLEMCLVYAGVHTISHWTSLLVYTVVIVGLMIVFRKEGHLRVLAFLSPIVGGLMIVSALSFGITYASLLFGSKLLHSLPHVHPVQGPWIAFVVMLFELSAPDVGFFAGSPYNPKGTGATTDRICGWVLWLMLVAVGWKIQKPFKRNKKKTTTSSTASARELRFSRHDADPPEGMLFLSSVGYVRPVPLHPLSRVGSAIVSRGRHCPLPRSAGAAGPRDSGDPRPAALHRTAVWRAAGLVEPPSPSPVGA